jgi:hypothetical protein
MHGVSAARDAPSRDPLNWQSAGNAPVKELPFLCQPADFFFW